MIMGSSDRIATKTVRDHDAALPRAPEKTLAEREGPGYREGVSAVGGGRAR